MAKLFTKDDVVFEPRVQEVYFEPTDIEEPKSSSIPEGMLEEIKEQVLNANNRNLSKEDHFTVKKGKRIYDISNSSITPRTNYKNPKFREIYTKQLEELLFTVSPKVDPETLVPILALMESIKKGSSPIKLVYKGHNKYLPLVVSILNDFFKTNFYVIDSILLMFENTYNLPKENV